MNAGAGASGSDRDSQPLGGTAPLGVAGPLLLLLAASGLLLPYLGYLTDDSYIHFQFAKNLMRGDGFAFNAGEPTYGATSPLWVLLLAAMGRFVPGADATPLSVAYVPPLVWIAKIAGAAAVLLAVLAMLRLGRRLGWSPAERLALAGFLALHAWLARWGISGMETPLAVLLVVLALEALAATLLEGRGRASTAGVWFAFASLARPEVLFLPLLAGMALAVASRGAEVPRSPRARPFAVGFALPYGAWLVAAHSLFHRLLPNTSAAKAGAWLDLERALTAVRESLRASLAAEAVPIALAVLALAFGAGEVWRRLPSGRRAFWLVVALWPVTLVGFFALAGVQVVSRYLLIATPCVLVLGLAGFRHLTRGGGPTRRPAGVPLVLALLLHGAINFGATLLVSAPAARAHAAGLRDSLGEIGIWARETTPPGTLFAAADIGAFGYYSDRRVLDLYGLVTPAMAPLTIRDGYDRVVHQLAFESVERPLYLIDRARAEARLEADEPESPYRFLFARRIPNLGITRPGEWVYSVYRIDWAAWDGLRPRLAQR